MSWRIVLGRGTALEPLSGAENMAIDAALLDSVRAGAPPVLRFYLWAPACLSLGRNQPARGFYDPDRIRSAGLDLVRRPTGGLAVLHDEELTYSVIAPLATFGRPRAAYYAINRWIVAGLRDVGVDAAVATGHRTTSPALAPWRGTAAAAPCFATPAAGEVIAAGRKLVGSAQRCEAHTLLQHGSILIDGRQDRVRELGLAGGGGASPLPGEITLRELTGRSSAPLELARAIAAAAGIPLAPAPLGCTEADRARTLRRHFASDAWTWRR